jgi:hypothetical protein
MEAFAIAAAIAVVMLLLVNVESWYPLASESLKMLITFAGVAVLAIFALRWIGWLYPTSLDRTS